MMPVRQPSALVLEDGFTLFGDRGGQATSADGEVVFNTCMTGYEEVLSDPSYAGQIVVMTNPLIGNYGTNESFQESGRPWARALITRQLSSDYFHWQASDSLRDWLNEWNVPILTGCDTRRLVRHLREVGAQRAIVAPLTRRYSAEELSSAPEIVDLIQQAGHVKLLGEQELVRQVSDAFIDSDEVLSDSLRPRGLRERRGLRIVVVDFGVKRNILRSLRARGVDLRVVPHDATAAEILSLQPHGVVLSNGPGDPARLTAEIATTSALIGHVPLLGICLGHQLIAQAAGARTSRLRFGHHGGNHPVIELRTGRIRITSQNHEFQVDAETLPEESGLIVTERNLHDGSVEALAHRSLPVRAYQYHPEGAPGPQDSQEIFDDFLAIAAGESQTPIQVIGERAKPKTVLIIGSGPIVIGQAAEFDYAGTQACKALREEDVETILVNSNPATIMTDEGIAHRVYIEPLTLGSLEAIIERERPDGLIGTMGGQTALNLAVALADSGALDRYGVRLLGTPLEAIRTAEDRREFKRLMQAIDEPVPLSCSVTTVEQALKFATIGGFPLVVRPAFTLGGTGGGLARTREDLIEIVEEGLQTSPIGQVLVEKYLQGWKEIEFEVMRDAVDTCVAVCGMENVDPMGVHTGDSIVVAPCQTLSDRQYQRLRSAALRIIRALCIEGGCNVQFALDPESDEYFVIEVNPRVSRSSALASKATGYPIARIAAKIAVGRRLDEITNSVTGNTSAAFEPALDYCVVKIPRWPFDKFPEADRTLGIQMKSTGEAMAIERTFEAALNKALRAIELAPPRSIDIADLSELLARPNDQRLWAALEALRQRQSASHVSALTGFAPWFTSRIADLVAQERELSGLPLNRELYLQAKRAGFSDERIRELAGVPRSVMSDLRTAVRPTFRQVDTCAAEFQAATPYYYSTYEEEDEMGTDERGAVVVIGSGPIRIGQGIEFDYCSVHASRAAQDAGYAAVLINSNPETVSTDFDASTRLYFEPLDIESVLAVLRRENPIGTLFQFGGQTALNLARDVAAAGYRVMGSPVETIDRAENRHHCALLLHQLGIRRPPGGPTRSTGEALSVAARIGYPVVVRPSYVLGGRAVEVVNSPAQLKHYVKRALAIGARGVIWVDKYLDGIELDVDAVSDGNSVVIPGLLEEVERAGVHSGDSFAVYPPRALDRSVLEQVVHDTTVIGRQFGIVGLLNVQFVVRDGVPYVLEVNPRASRTVPFMSKVTGTAMVRIATEVALGRRMSQLGFQGGLLPCPPVHAVKAPVFSMAPLRKVDSRLGPEMKSTGEAMGIAREHATAQYKAFVSVMRDLPSNAVVLWSAGQGQSEDCRLLLDRLRALGLEMVLADEHPDPLGLIRSGELDLVVEITARNGSQSAAGPSARVDGYAIRRAAAEWRLPYMTSIDTVRAFADAMLQRPAAKWLPASLTDYVPDGLSAAAIRAT